MRILITGAHGQLATDLRAALQGHDLIPCTHADLDVTRADQVAERMARHEPDVVINTAAYHKVDECEAYPEKTFAVNAFAPRLLARACRDRDAALVHVSTNFVFDGRASQPYTECDLPGPLSVYGASKLAGEHLVRATLPRHWLIRTTGLYGLGSGRGGGKGGNFIELMLRLGRERGAVTVVDDQIMTPTSTADLAGAIGRLIETEAYGTYHITNGGACSYFEFARAIFDRAGLAVDLRPISTAEYDAPAQRPLYTVLDNRRLHRTGIPELRPWEAALDAYFRSRRGIERRLA